MYGVHSSSYNKYVSPNKGYGKIAPPSPNIAKSGGGNIFARPFKKIPQSALNNNNNNNNDDQNRISIKSPIRMGLLNQAMYDDKSGDHHQDKIAQSFNELTSETMNQVNTLWQNFASMFQ